MKYKRKPREPRSHITIRKGRITVRGPAALAFFQATTNIPLKGLLRRGMRATVTIKAG